MEAEQVDIGSGVREYRECLESCVRSIEGIKWIGLTKTRLNGEFTVDTLEIILKAMKLGVRFGE